jgi:hypothetical protein
VLEPETVSAAAATLHDDDAGLVSMLPRAERGSVSGDVLLPMVSHAAFALFPAALVHTAANPRLAAAFGPFLLVTRAAYEGAGGHAAERDHIVDDVQLSRNVKAAGHGVRLVNGTDLVQTRWYHGVGDIWRGFSKNAYGALDYNPWVGSAVVFVLMPLLLTPFVRVAFGAWAGDISVIALWQVILLVAGRAVTAHLGRDAQWSTPLHAVTVAFWGMTLAWSMTLSGTHRAVTWKGRDLSTRPFEQPEA